MYYTYVLEFSKDGRRYIGHTKDLKKRVEDHHNGYVSSTSTRKKFELIYYEACLSKEDAMHREKYFKTGFGRRFLKNRLKRYYGNAG